MSSGCGDVLSLADLQTAKKHQIFEAEVITGKSGGVAGGADIDYATNAVTGQTQKTLPSILADVIKSGFRPAPFTFETGGTLGVDDADAVVFNPVPLGDGVYYSWQGALPKTVPAGSTPQTTGGVGDGAWLAAYQLTSFSEFEKILGISIYPKGAEVSEGDLINAESGLFAITHSGKFKLLTNLPASGTVSAIDSASNSITIGGKKHWMLEYYGDAVNLSEDVIVAAGEQMIINGAPNIYGRAIRGAGSVVGVVGNLTDMKAFDIKANIVRSGERDQTAINADVIVDYMQESAGTYATFADGLTAVAALVSGGQTTDITMLIRACRFAELEAGATIEDQHIPGFGTFNVTTDNTTIVVADSTIVVGQNSQARLTIKPYGSESVTFTPVMRYISANGGSRYKKSHRKVTNTTGTIFLEAYDQDMKKVEVSNNYNRNTGKLPRNRNKRITQVAGNTFTLRPSFVDSEGLKGEELSSVALRINQNYSSSWNNISTLNTDGSITYVAHGPWDTSPDGLYFDGFYYATGFSAPYWLRNAKYLLKDDTYCVDSSSVYIPDGVGGLYIPTAAYGFGLTINTSSVTIDGVNFAYFDIPKTDLQAIWSERFQNAGCLDVSLSTACEFKNFKAHDITGLFMRTSKNSSYISDFELDNIGCCGFVVAYQSNCSNMHMRNFRMNNLGKYSSAANGVYVLGYNVAVTNGLIENISFTGIATSSSWQDAGNIGKTTTGTFSDISVVGVGKRDGIQSDLHHASDFGAISCGGKQIPVDYHFSNIYINDVNGAALVRSLFLDDGVSGFSITDSFIGAVDGQFALDARQVGNGTYNNKFLNVVVLGNVRLASLNQDSLLTGVVSGNANTLDTNGAIAFKPSVNPFRFERRSDFLTAVPYSILNSGNFTDYTFKFVTGNGLLTATAY